MARVSFTPNLRRHIQTSTREVGGSTVDELLTTLFAAEPALRNYVVDDQGDIRKHINIFVNNEITNDRAATLSPDSEVFIMQALSGG